MNDTGNPIRILIADDNAAARTATIALLEASEAVTFWEAVDGMEAVRLAENVRPDVILMDVQMPKLDGITATRRIKQSWPVIRIVVLTMYCTYRTAALAAGADAFLLKGEAADGLITAVLEQSRKK